MLQSPEAALPCDLGVIIPVYRAHSAFPALLQQLRTQLASLRWHLFLVDDSGQEETGSFLDHCADRHTTVIHLAHNSGQQNAVLCGIRTALPLCRNFLCMDDDGQHPVQLIPRLLEALESCSIVYGIPSTRRTGLRRFGSAARDFLFRLCFSLPKYTTVSSFRVFNHDIAEKAAAFKGSFFYFSAVILAGRPQIRCVPYAPGPEVRASSYNLKKLAVLYLNIVKFYFFHLPQKEKELYRIECIFKGE